MAPLTAEQLAFYESEGYLVLEEFANHEECNRMMTQMEKLLKEFNPSHVTIFSTKTGQHSYDQYFNASANNISFFFEENAFNENGKLKQPKELSINKVGHALHELDPVFKEFSESSKFHNLLMSLKYRKPILIESMYIFKQP